MAPSIFSRFRMITALLIAEKSMIYSLITEKLVRNIIFCELSFDLIYLFWGNTGIVEDKESMNGSANIGITTQN